MNYKSVQVARYLLGFSWIYHGLFPKLLTVAPIEQRLTATFGFSDVVSYMVTKSAGVAEVLLGIAILVLYKNKPLIIANIIVLIALLIFVIIQMPVLLIEAFNPVTTNLSLIGLSYFLLQAGKNNSLQ